MDPAWHWPKGPLGAGPAVVFDLDGVVSDARGRQHFVEGPRRDWDAFFDACGEDPLNRDVAELIGVLADDVAVVLLTARPSRVREATLAWLEGHRLRYDLLVMRRRGDHRGATEFKREQVASMRAHGFDLRLALEDDPRNAEMFEREGVPCLYVHSGYYA